MSHIRPFDVSYHLRESFQEELCDMLSAGVIEKCKVSTKWNTKEFPVPKADMQSCRVEGGQYDPQEAAAPYGVL